MKIFLAAMALALSVTVMTGAQAKSPHFNDPKHNGQRVANCLTPGANCGKKAADKFCKNNGFSSASQFSTADAKGPAAYLSSAVTCRSCTYFARIRCSIDVNATSDTDIGEVGN